MTNQRPVKLAVLDGQVTCPVWARSKRSRDCFGCARFRASSPGHVVCLASVTNEDTRGAEAA
jgi:hypothetical protein